MGTLTVFGLVAVTCMLACYALEERSPWFTLAFGIACFAASAYGWLAGTWPFGIVEAVWGIVAVRKWYRRTRATTPGSGTKEEDVGLTEHR